MEHLHISIRAMLTDNLCFHLAVPVELEQSPVGMTSTPNSISQVGKKSFVSKERLPKCHEHTKMTRNHLRSGSITHNRDSWTILTAGGDINFTEVGLLDANVVVAVQSLTAEVLWPIGVLIVDYEQREASIFVECLHTRYGRGGGADYACALITCSARQALHALQETFTRFRGTRRCRRVLRTALAEAQRQLGPCWGGTGRCWRY